MNNAILALENNKSTISNMGHGAAVTIVPYSKRAIRKQSKIVSMQVPPEPDMNSLLTAVATNRDKQAYAKLFTHFAPRLKSMLLGLGTNAETAEELAQETMLSVWRKCEMFDSQKASAATWIFTIARNLRIDRFRSEKRPEFDPNDPSLIPEAETMADEQLSLNDRQKLVKAALADLPEEQRAVVNLSFIEDLSHQAIAERLQLPLGTVKSRLRLSFEKLRTMLRSEA